MEFLLHNATALKALEVSVTNTRSPSTATERASAVTQKEECVGVAYVNTSQELKSLTIVSRASD